MKISLNTLRHINRTYGCAADPAPEGVEALLARIGSQLGGVDTVTYVGSKYDKAVIVRVVEVSDHPNADRLHVCTIDDAGKTTDVERLESGLVQVVCGAPNVRPGMTTVWLPTGATVPSSFDADPFVLEARELRGVVSNGMLASPKELALGDSHDGIVDITEDLEPGLLFGETYDLADDVIIDIENKMFTHRPDCFGWLGVAREIAGIQDMPFKSPQWYRSDATIKSGTDNLLPLKVDNTIPDLVPRFVAVPIAGVKVGPSPIWLQARLSRIGLRPINNIVDITNLFMLETGQPLHAYDYDKVLAADPGADTATIVIRKPHDGESITLLNGKKIQPRNEAIMIASASRPIGLGGVMGGGDTEVDHTTTNIILEVASFDMYSIRRTAMAHGIFTDAVTRFNKGQSPLQNLAVAAKVVEDIQVIAGGQVAGPVIDNVHVAEEVMNRRSLHPEIDIDAAFINQRLGIRISAEDMARLLRNVEFDVDVTERTMVDETDGKKVNTDTLTIKAPFWRTDIEILEDIVEEIGRLYGYDKLPLNLPARNVTPARRSPEFEVRTSVRTALRQSGANELLCYSFVHGKLLQKAGQDSGQAYRLSNALSPDLQYYRLSVMPSLLDKVHANIKSGYDSFALYEIGKSHHKGLLDDAGLPREAKRLALVYSANDKAAARHAGAPYYQAREYLERLFADTRTETVQYISAADYDKPLSPELVQMAAPFEPTRAALLVRDDAVVGIVGEFKHDVRRQFKLPAFCAGFEISLDIVAPTTAARYTSLSRYPRVEQDICLKVPVDTPYQRVYEALSEQLTTKQPAAVVTQLQPIDIFQRPDETDHKQITFRYSITSYDKTLTDNEVSSLLNDAASAVLQELRASII